MEESQSNQSEARIRDLSYEKTYGEQERLSGGLETRAKRHTHVYQGGAGGGEAGGVKFPSAPQQRPVGTGGHSSHSRGRPPDPKRPANHNTF